VKARADVEGYDEASDAIEAVQRMAKENYDVMLLDISGRLGPGLHAVDPRYLR
jgi:signal recognition particle GTPase